MLFRRYFEEFMRYEQIPQNTDMSREQIEKLKVTPIQLDYLTVDDMDITKTRKLISSQKEEPRETFGVGLVLSFLDEPRAVWTAHMDVLPEHIQKKISGMRGETLGKYAGLDADGNVFYTAAGNPLFYRVLQEKIGYTSVARQDWKGTSVLERRKSV